MKVLLKIPLSEFSGYGNDGIGLAQAFMRRGDDVYLQPTHVSAPLPEEVAKLLTKRLEAPFDLFINHVDPMQLACSPEVSESAGVTIAWTMWEYTNLLNMDKKPLKTMRKRLKNFDALVGYSDLDPESFAPYYDGPKFVQQGGFNPEDWPEIERSVSDKEFYFFMIGVLSERKDPWKAVHAFQMAKAEDPEFDRWARLSLKTTAPGLHSKIEDLFRQPIPGAEPDPETGQIPEYSSLRIFYDIWPKEVVQQFYAVQNVLLAPSRGEGKNMPALEFMSTGGTVIATNWAGHKQWLNPEYSYPLDFTLEQVDIENPDTQNARADVEHLKNLMLHCFHNRAEVREKGKLAAQVVPAISSWDAVVQRLLEKIRTEVPEKGERLWMLSQLTGAGRGNG